MEFFEGRSDAVLAKVRALVEPLLAARHVELVELTYRREGPQTVLRFLVDTASGITVEECRRLNWAVGALLEEHEVIRDPYLLEVASPGLDRPLKTARDFERVINRRVWIQTSEPVEGRHEVVGTLISVGDALMTMELDQGQRVRVPLAFVVRARQEIAFDR